MIQYDSHTIVPVTRRGLIELSRCSSTEGDDTFWMMTGHGKKISNSLRSVLAREYKISSESTAECLIRGVRLLDSPRGPALALEGFNGLPLEYFNLQLFDELKNVLEAGRLIARMLQNFHDSGLIHRGIDTKSLFLSVSSEGVIEKSALSFLGLSIERSGMSPVSLSSDEDIFNFLSPEYIAPEITGLVDIETDHRADLYSLGIVFYEMMTGAPPFRSDHFRDMLNWHVARQPHPPREINGSIPTVLSDIVLRLLQKEPAERYESAEALAADLETCLKNISGDGTIKAFTAVPVALDSQIHFSNEIAGRKDEQKLLSIELNDVRKGGAAAVFISGPGGVGKTVLVRDLEKEVAAAGGWFVSGKFDQNQVDMPYAVFADVVGSIVKQILMTKDRELKLWKKKLITALGQNSSLFTVLAPDLKYLVDVHEKKFEGDPESMVSLFRQTFKKLITAIAGVKNPLVVFLDDLQWADTASLELLKFFVESSPVSGLMIAGAFRDNEIDDGHPLADILKQAETAQYQSLAIHLESLSGKPVEEIICRAMDDNVARPAALTELVVRKTGGNPFYVKKFIQSLYERKILHRDKSNTWSWDKDKINALPATDNVAQLLVLIIEKLTEQEKEVLKIASCVKDRFSREILMVVTGTGEKRLSGILNSLLAKDILVYDEKLLYSFSHDRVKEATAGLLNREEEEELHLAIGRAMLQLYGGKRLKEKIFEVADHLNSSRGLIYDEDEYDELQKLNVQAAEKALQMIAYERAVTYNKTAFSLVKNRHEKYGADYIFEIYKRYAHSLYLNNEYDEALAIIDESFDFANTDLQQVSLHEISMNIKIITLQTEEAIINGLHSLKKLGYDLFKDRKNSKQRLQELRQQLEGYFSRDHHFTEIPLCRDERILHIQRILEPVSIATFQQEEMDFNIVIILHILLLTFQHGITPQSMSGFSSYGFIAGRLWGEFERAKELGDAAIEICKKFEYDYQMCIVCVQVPVFINFWHSHLKHAEKLLALSEKKGIETGSYLFLNYCISHQVINSFALGNNIDACFNLIDEKMQLLESICHEEMIASVIAFKLAYYNLLGKTENLQVFSFEEISEKEFLKEWKEKCLYVALGVFLLNKVLIEYIYCMYDASLSEAENIESYSNYFLCHYYYVDFYFFRSLNIVSDFSRFSTAEAAERLAWVKNFQVELKSLAERIPDNLMFKYLLIEAELRRLENRIPEAMALYDQAISSAYNNEYRQYEAIICERAAEFWFEYGKDEFALIYLDRAFNCYSEWGAVRKIELMKEEWPDRYQKKGAKGDFSEEEVVSLLNSFHSLSGHLEPEGLVNELADVALTHSGAERFLLFIEQEGGRRIMVSKLNDSEEKSSMEITTADNALVEERLLFPVELIRYVKRSGKEVFLYDDDSLSVFKNTRYIQSRNPRSALCLRSETPRGDVVWYLENSFVKGAFADINVRLLEVISRQALLCIENILFRQSQGAGIPHGSLLFKYEGERKLLSHSQIIYCSSHGRKSVIHTREESYETGALLKELESKLPSDTFLRIHKQYIVNREFISSLKREPSGAYSVLLSDDDDSRLLVGRSYYAHLSENLKGSFD